MRFIGFVILDLAWILAGTICLSFRFQWIAAFCFVFACLIEIILLAEGNE